VQTILVNSETGGVFKALDEGQRDALLNHPTGNWKKLDSASVNRDDLAAQAKAAGVVFDAKTATKTDLAEGLLTAAANRAVEES
jgi:hypothetical protein